MGNQLTKKSTIEEIKIKKIYDQSGRDITSSLFFPANVSPKYLKNLWTENGFLRKNQDINSIMMCFDNEKRKVFNRNDPIKLGKNYTFKFI